MGDCWDGGGGDGSWGWEAADVACASYAGVGVGRLGGGLGRVNEVQHGARHCAFYGCGGLGFGRVEIWYDCEERRENVGLLGMEMCVYRGVRVGR